MQKLNEYRGVSMVGMSEDIRLEDNRVVKTGVSCKMHAESKGVRFLCRHCL